MSKGRDRALALGMLAAFGVAVAVGALGIDVRSTLGGRAAVDEPQYLLSALSLAEDGDLDISDELAAERWRAFHDTQLPVQTEVRGDGSAISPHDPLLPILLAVPMGLGGFTAAKVTMCVLAGLSAALAVWLAVRRFGVPAAVAAAVVGTAFASPPLGIYAQQVYPEMPAALAVLAAVAALTGPVDRRGQAVFVAAVVALPWLSVKYAPVAAAVALVGLARLWRLRGPSTVAVLSGVLAAMGVGYLVVHRVVWGGWTVYASGDFFTGPGEFAVVGENPDYVGRSERLTALLLDRDWGLGAWQPGWVLIVPAVAALLAARPRGWVALLGPALVGWLVATFVALTMSGFWSPGRQVVVVLPLLVVALAWWLARAAAWVRVAAAALGAMGVLSMGALLLDGWDGQITWVFRFNEVDNPVYDGWRTFLPPYREGSGGAEVWVRHGIWMAVFVIAAAAAYRAARRVAVVPAEPGPAEPASAEPASADPAAPLDSVAAPTTRALSPNGLAMRESRVSARAIGLAVGVAADAVFADPRRGHPVAAFGRLAAAAERRCWRDSKVAGMGYVLACVGAPVAVGLLAQRGCAGRPGREAALTAAATWAVLGGTSLGREGSLMARHLAAGDLPAARDRLTHLCARDPAGLDAAALARAAVESVAENTGDAVVAPLLWGAAVGLPGLLGYRAVNTLDAMVGYRSPRHTRFGWAAARLDDVANLLPSRVTGALTVLAAPFAGGCPGAAARALRADHCAHPSPNAGWCEAAAAGALGVRLGGENRYGGTVERRPVLNAAGREVEVGDIERAVRLSRAVGLAAAGLAVGLAILAGRQQRAPPSGGCHPSRPAPPPNCPDFGGRQG